MRWIFVEPPRMAERAPAVGIKQETQAPPGGTWVLVAMNSVSRIYLSGFAALASDPLLGFLPCRLKRSFNLSAISGKPGAAFLDART